MQPSRSSLELTATCKRKASDFKSRQQLRAEELEAVSKAIQIVSRGAVDGSADKHLHSGRRLKLFATRPVEIKKGASKVREQRQKMRDGWKSDEDA